jgi:hypothetical protein
VAPALQSKEAELKRSQLEDVLNHKIQERPTPDALVEKHILGMLPPVFIMVTPVDVVVLALALLFSSTRY